MLSANLDFWIFIERQLLKCDSIDGARRKYFEATKVVGVH